MNRKLPAVLLLALLALLSVSSWFIPHAETPPERGARSSSNEGRRGLLNLLSNFGFDAQLWEKRPGALPSRPDLVWLAKLPAGTEAAAPEEASPSPASGAAPLREALLQGLSNPRHYRRFAAQGGCVLAEVKAEEDLARLATDFDFFEIEQLTLLAARQETATASARFAGKWISGEPLELSVPDAPTLAGLESLRYGNVLLADGSSSALILEVPIGRGSLVLVTCGSIFDNVGLATLDHSVVAVRLAERAARAGSIWIDESGGLGGDAPTLLDLAVQPRALAFTASLALFVLLFLWRSLFAREIPRDPPAILFLSPRTRALARARLFQRARRFDLLAQALRHGIVRRLGEASRVPPATCSAALQTSEGARLFAKAIAAGGDESNWIDAIVARPVANARDLVQLDSDLRALENRLEYHARRAPRRRAGRKTTLTTSM